MFASHMAGSGSIPSTPSAAKPLFDCLVNFPLVVQLWPLRAPAGSPTGSPHLDVCPGPAQKTQRGGSGAVGPQRHLLPEMLQAALQLGTPAVGKVSGGQSQSGPASAREDRRARGGTKGDGERQGKDRGSPAFLQLIVHGPAESRGAWGQRCAPIARACPPLYKRGVKCGQRPARPRPRECSRTRKARKSREQHCKGPERRNPEALCGTSETRREKRLSGRRATGKRALSLAGLG